MTNKTEIDENEWPTFWLKAEQDTDWEAESKKANDFWRNKLNSCKYVVAPMVDQSELAWRILSRRHGAQLCYTPMLHAHIFAKDHRFRRDNLVTTPEDSPLIVQFCANYPETLLKAAELAQDQCVAVDLNLGCPQSIAKKGHYGAFLQDEWQLIFDMVNICYRNLKVPITCKIRRFKSVDKTIAYARMLQAAGCRLLTVHGRTREMKGIHTGMADWTYIKAVREALHIPVFGNGNIQYLSDVHKCIQETGAVGIMSAEGNLHNPAIFSEETNTVWDMSMEYIQLVRQYPCHLSYIRGHLFKLLHHTLQKHLDLRSKLAKAKVSDEFENFIQLVKDTCKEDFDKYKSNPEEFDLGGLNLPYWICQPYVRPTPEESAQRKETKPHKRNALHLQEELNGDRNDTEKLSFKKAKKLLKNPNKVFLTRESKFIKCPNCGNPKGQNCDHAMCKPCCKRYIKEKDIICMGHKLNIGRRKQDDKDLKDLKITDKLEENTEKQQETKTETQQENTTEPHPSKDIDCNNCV